MNQIPKAFDAMSIANHDFPELSRIEVLEVSLATLREDFFQILGVLHPGRDVIQTGVVQL